jgi:hypothetical protein
VNSVSYCCLTKRHGRWKKGGKHTGTVVVGLKQSKATANGKDVSVSLENHCDDWLGCEKREEEKATRES